MTTLEDSYILFSDGFYRDHISKHKWLKLNSVEVLAMRGVSDKVYIMGKSRPGKNGGYTKSNPQRLYSETYDAKTHELISCDHFSPPGEEKDYLTGIVVPGVFSFAGLCIYALSEFSLSDKSGALSLVSGTTAVILGIPAIVSQALKIKYDQGRPKREELREKEKRFYRKLELIKRLSPNP